MYGVLRPYLSLGVPRAALIGLGGREASLSSSLGHLAALLNQRAQAKYYLARYQGIKCVPQRQPHRTVRQFSRVQPPASQPASLWIGLVACRPMTGRWRGRGMPTRAIILRTCQGIDVARCRAQRMSDKLPSLAEHPIVRAASPETAAFCNRAGGTPSVAWSERVRGIATRSCPARAD